MLQRPYWIHPAAPADAFPHPTQALREPNGLLAVGGDLHPHRLLAAYRRGIFPWFNRDQPILWWSPDPRAVLLPGGLRISRSLRKTLKRSLFRITTDAAFARVVAACAAPRATQAGTWITAEMRQAYGELHRLGFAHSIECWQGEELSGGLYGVALGKVFFGESMFSRRSDASKVALAHLVERGYQLIDCQIPNPHLASLGAVEIPRERFLHLLDRWCAEAIPPTHAQRIPA